MKNYTGTKTEIFHHAVTGTAGLDDFHGAPFNRQKCCDKSIARRDGRLRMRTISRSVNLFGGLVSYRAHVLIAKMLYYTYSGGNQYR